MLKRIVGVSGDAVRVDHSGVFVNGERVEWSTLADGDEIVIGRHHLHFVDVPAISGMRYSHATERGGATQTS